MDVPLLIKQRLSELHLEQKDLAAAAQVTESYVSQLLARKKAPPAPGRTDIYDKIGAFLRLPAGELVRLAEAQRDNELRRKVSQSPSPLFKDYRELILRKCNPASRPEIRRIFEKEPFGELERLVTQKVLDVAQGIAREELRSDAWLHDMARLSQRSFEEMRVAMLEFLDSDVFHASVDGCLTFLDPIIDCWDIDLKTFSIEIVLNSRLAPASVRRFEFMEHVPEQSPAVEPGLAQFLKDPVLSRGITEEEIHFLRGLHFHERRPTPLYYYRELQNLRDPIHFTASESEEES